MAEEKRGHPKIERPRSFESCVLPRPIVTWRSPLLLRPLPAGPLQPAPCECRRPALLQDPLLPLAPAPTPPKSPRLLRRLQLLRWLVLLAPPPGRPCRSAYSRPRLPSRQPLK